MIALLSLLVPTVAAQESYTVTEAQINENFRVSNPRIAAISAASVDLQPGQVVIRGTVAPVTGGTYDVVATYSPSVVEGDVFWTLVSASVNGSSATADQLDTINATLSAGWQSWWRGATAGLNIIAITVSDTAITYTYDGREPGGISGELVIEDDAATLTVTEEEMNNSFITSDYPQGRMTDVFVDFQPNQVVISGTLTLLATGEAVSIQATYSPAVVDGMVEWTVVSVLADGGPADEEMQGHVEAILGSSWNAWWLGRLDNATLTSVQVTDNEIIYTFDLDANLPDGVSTTLSEDQITIVVTEQALNDGFGERRNVANAYADLQPGQVVITATYTAPRGNSFNTRIVLVPSAVDGAAQWTVSSVTVDGNAATQAQLEQINNALVNAWTAILQNTAGDGELLSVTITENEIIYTLARE